MMELNLLYVNDVHGYLDLHNELFYNQDGEVIEVVGGYARLATLINQIKDNHEHTILFDGGDTFHGTRPIIESKGEALVPILNRLDFKAMVGHWDFGYGPQHLKSLLSQLNYPMLGINVFNEDGSRFLPPSITLEIENLKIGVIGICNNIIDKTMPAHFSKGIKVTNGLEELPDHIAKLKEEGVEIIILLSHNGFPQDMKMMKEVDGIDICLSAHTHNRLYKTLKVNNTLIIQCGCHGSFLGHLKINIKNKSITSHQYELIKVDKSITPDKDMEKIIQNILLPYQNSRKKIIGSTEIMLHRYDTLNSTMDNLLLDAIKFVSHTKIAFSNGWRYGVPIDIGNITDNDLYNIVPVNPPVSTTELTGQEIIDMLEENLERTFSSDPMQQMGGYVKRCSGLLVNFRIENPKGDRIQEIYFENEHLEYTKTYKVGFITTQGVPEKYGKNRKKLDINAVDALREFFKANPVYKNSHYKTFNLV